MTQRTLGVFVLALFSGSFGSAQQCQVVVSPTGTTNFSTSGDADRIDANIAANPGKVVCLKDGAVFYLSHAIRLLGAGTVLRGQTQSLTNRPTLLLPPNQWGNAHANAQFYTELTPTATQPGGNIQNAVRTHSGLCPTGQSTCVSLPDIGCPGCEISYLVINGNYGVASGSYCRPAQMSHNGYPLVWIGGTSASGVPNTGLKVHHCVIENVAASAGLLIEGMGDSASVHDNNILNAGFNYDGGSGQTFWADGIDIQANYAQVYNNTLRDTTDGGIVLWKPGAKVYGNTITSQLRGGFGAINLVDDTDMRGVAISGNHITAMNLGSFDVGLGVGRAIWNCPTPQNGWNADTPPLSDFDVLPGDPNPGITPGIYNNTFAVVCNPAQPPTPTPVPSGTLSAPVPQVGPPCTTYGFFNHPFPINGAKNLKVNGNTFSGPAGQYGWFTGTGCGSLPPIGQEGVELGYCPTNCDLIGQTTPAPIPIPPAQLWNLIGGRKVVPGLCK